jgi:hypothetical protein
MLFAGQPARAIDFVGAKGSLTAEVSFVQLGTNLVVTLSNISRADVLAPNAVLTSLFFTLPGNPTLTPFSATVETNAAVQFAPPGGTGPNVGGEWAYRGNLSDIPGGGRNGISAASLGVFNLPNFNGPDLQLPLAVSGIDYGITSEGDNTNTGNIFVKGKYPLIQDSVVFTFDLPTDYVLTNVTSVTFQYGPTFGNPRLSGVQPIGPIVIPESSSLGLAVCGIALLMIIQAIFSLVRPNLSSRRR